MGTYTIVGWCGYRLACGVVGSIHDQKRGKKMPRLIVCRNCTESDCTYCNINILAVALERGYFNSLMREQHTVQIESELVPVRHGHWIDINENGSLWECSICGDRSCCSGNYCMECGTKMDEEVNGNN